MRENSSRNQDGLKYQKLYNWGRTLITSGVLRNHGQVSVGAHAPE